MATTAEQTFIRAVAAAEGVRQVAKAAAFTTWAFGVGGAFTTYVAALESADNAYITSINSALSTLGACGISVPNQGPSSQAPVVVPGLIGLSGPIPSGSTTFGAVA